MQATGVRKLPVGIQTFSEIREEGYVYVDKTDLVWRLANQGAKYNYLSRPRRFGKTLLVSTLQSYFEGRKELFEGLRIMELETEWQTRPVIRLDMSQAGENAHELQLFFESVFDELEAQYGVSIKSEVSLPRRLHNIIVAAHKMSGQKVAILIDEYDFPLQHFGGTPEHEKCASLYRSVFATVKAEDEHIRFVFITGITKFTQISLFSAFNNLVNISFDSEYEDICGISQQELESDFVPEIDRLAEENEWTKEESLSKLKDNYDGYHFSKKCRIDIYNPFSLIYALDKKEISSYWASSGASTLIAKFVKDAEIRLREFDGCRISSDII